ncbi:DUF664 domain-containing protein [Lentzea sp.]|uniref:mycothiol transferase n=1 Tax=Lentzea sp. TaxID=56099 RepID=UPI002C7BB3F3|nr:DUF664 domain-containing protein [Lentzea sp.]HUQ58391.1 DUF664 domain-containing protein [Lentzea sp.]
MTRTRRLEDRQRLGLALGAQDTPEQLIALWQDGHRVSLRWISSHMVEEYSRHNGHADLIRDAIASRIGK